MVQAAARQYGITGRRRRRRGRDGAVWWPECRRRGAAVDSGLACADCHDDVGVGRHASAPESAASTAPSAALFPRSKRPRTSCPPTVRTTCIGLPDA